MPSDSFLAMHCRYYGCVPWFDQTVIVGCSKDELTGLKIESEKIDYFDTSCISKSSITLFDK